MWAVKAASVEVVELGDRLKCPRQIAAPLDFRNSGSIFARRDGKVAGARMVDEFQSVLLLIVTVLFVMILFRVVASDRTESAAEQRRRRVAQYRRPPAP
jgi:hypothetical protein